MEWTRSETIALAKHSCTLCHGIGLRSSWGSSVVPCNCVLRAIFRACYSRFRHCADKQECLTQKSFEYLPGSGETAVTYDRKNEEFLADFVVIARRSLDEREYRLFRYHYLLGADWKLCCKRIGFDRGMFFHSIYRIQQKLGKAYRETQPYPLFPVYEYYEEIKRPIASNVARVEEEIQAQQLSPRVIPRRVMQPYPVEQIGDGMERGEDGDVSYRRQRKIA